MAAAGRICSDLYVEGNDLSTSLSDRHFRKNTFLKCAQMFSTSWCQTARTGNDWLDNAARVSIKQRKHFKKKE